MTVEELLTRLDGVRRTGKGFQARCPAHEDRSPSLSISHGERAILLKCWSGCELQEITKAIGICVKDLFFNADLDPHMRKKAQQHREQHRKKQARVNEAMGFTIDALREADCFIRSRLGLDIATWKNERLNDELNALADAYALLWIEESEQWT